MSASPGSLLETHHVLAEVVATFRAAVENERTNRTDPGPVAVILACHFCNHHVWVRMLDEEVTEGVPSSCRRDVDFVTFFGTQASGFADGKSGPQERRYQRRQYRAEAESYGEADLLDGRGVSEHDSCLRAESVGVARGNVDGMCLNTCRL